MKNRYDNCLDYDELLKPACRLRRRPLNAHSLLSIIEILELSKNHTTRQAGSGYEMRKKYDDDLSYDVNSNLPVIQYTIL
ncbi:MAG: hypothetical protein JW720_04655 [Sedimentisphaerales bacterium]|nr:hypothetical protein [Sedimentisphaerales bacterium]